MLCGHSLTCGALHHFAISSFLFLIIVTSSCTQFRFNAHQGGRQILLPIRYAKIGSKPPRCDKLCNSCAHCEAIQVPTNPQHMGKNKNSNSPESTTIAYSRGGEGDDYYKPMSWKCKCGDLIFNP